MTQKSLGFCRQNIYLFLIAQALHCLQLHERGSYFSVRIQLNLIYLFAQMYYMAQILHKSEFDTFSCLAQIGKCQRMIFIPLKKSIRVGDLFENYIAIKHFSTWSPIHLRRLQCTAGVPTQITIAIYQLYNKKNQKCYEDER